MITYCKKKPTVTGILRNYSIPAVINNLGGRGKGEDRWYTIDEWCAIPEDKHATIQKACADCKKRGGGKNPSKNLPKKKFGSVPKLKDKVKNQKRQLAVMNAKRKAGTANDDAMSESGSDRDQRKHPGLTRQNTVPRKDRSKGADGKS
jgi:hypothetical protein